VAAASGSESAMGKAIAQGIGAEKPKVISPELRGLLSRKVEVLSKVEVKDAGGGV
jgi:hypothetical protein